MTTRPLPETLVQCLHENLSSRFSLAEAVRIHHGHDESHFCDMPPQAVVHALIDQDVIATVLACEAHSIPLIPYGAGSSLEGHILAPQGGISLDISGMDKILAINPDDFDVTVQPGVRRKQLNAALRNYGLFFPVDPGADATLGGMASTRASGTNAVRYGTMRENVLGLSVVTSGGKIVRTGGRARKSAAGYDLTRLFVGAEGTLGVITELTLRVHPLPEAVSAAVCAYPDLDAAVRSVIQIMQIGIPVARIELLDERSIHAVNLYSRTRMETLPTLFFEFHGSEATVREHALVAQEISQEHGGRGFLWADHPEDRTKLWEARHNAYFACLGLRPGSRGWTTDVCVPISRLADCVNETRTLIEQSGLVAPLLGHVGDGNFHLVILVDPNDSDEILRAEALARGVGRLALAAGGTCTGEHGVGLGKKELLLEEYGTPAIDLMRTIKTALDPAGIFNPGKIFS